MVVTLFRALKRYDRQNVMSKMFRPILATKLTLVVGLVFAEFGGMLKGINKLIMCL